METVNIARLRNALCAYLARVQAGEEVLVKDRQRAIARLAPLGCDVEGDDEAVRLAAAGILRLPEHQQPTFAELQKLKVGRGSRRRALAAVLAERSEEP